MVERIIPLVCRAVQSIFFEPGPERGQGYLDSFLSDFDARDDTLADQLVDAGFRDPKLPGNLGDAQQPGLLW